MHFLDRPAVLRAASAALIAMWLTQGVIAVAHTPSGNHTVVGAVEHVQLATLTLCALALIPVVLRLGALAGARRAALVALAGANSVGALCVISNVNSGDASFFDAVAVPSLLAWFAGFVALGVALARRRAVPLPYAIALPLSMLIGGAGGHAGGGFVAALYWLLLTREIGVWSASTRRGRMQATGVAVGVVLLLIVPAAASASTVTSDGTTAVVTGTDAGENVDVMTMDGRIYVGGADAGPGCTLDLNEVSCPIGSGGVDVRLGGGDDRAFSYATDVPAGFVRIDLGAGNDSFEGRQAGEVVQGGAGDDKLVGYDGADVLDGGDGQDTLQGGDGADTLRGGAGNDQFAGGAGGDVIDGGADRDSVSDWASPDNYVASTATVTLDGRADDGLPGEGDNVTGVEVVESNSGLRFVGDDAANVAIASQVGGAGDFDGRGGDDTLTGSDADDRIDGGAGADTITGGYGNDTIVGGAGQDTILGDRAARCNEMACDISPGSAADTIDARDGERDTVNCGPGTDTALVDSIDVVDSSCETVTRGGAAAAAAGGATGAAGAPAAATGGRLTLSGRRSIRALLAGRLSVTVTGSRARAQVSVRVLRGKTVIAKGTGRADAKGKAKVRLRATKAGRRALRRARSAKLTVSAGTLRESLRFAR